MSNIISCTTPTIKYNFNVVDPAHIVEAYLTIYEGRTLAVERDLTTAVVGEHSLSWTLTQAETLEFDKSVVAQLNWLTDSGVRGASEKVRIAISENLKNEVI